MTTTRLYVRTGVAALAVLSVGSLGVWRAAATHGGSAELRQAPHDKAIGLTSRSATTTAASRYVEATYVPAGAQIVLNELTNRGVQHLFYSLPGAANANTVPASGATDANFATVHPETQLQVYVVPGAQPAAVVDLALTNVAPVTIGDIAGTLTTLKTGAGVVRIDWDSNDTHYVVLTDRLLTPEGLSGITSAELLKVARGLVPASPPPFASDQN